MKVAENSGIFSIVKWPDYEQTNAIIRLLNQKCSDLERS